MDAIPTLTAYKSEDFRRWLKAHGRSQRRMAVVVHKRHTGKPAPTHRELIEEAICFGWIDTTIKRLDEDRFLRHFARRTDKSKWSDNTLSYAKQLVKDGRMTKEGLYFYKLGLKKPTHHQGIPKDPKMPAELKAALSKNKKAKARFEAFPPSAKRVFYRWLLRAKLPGTRQKRLKQIVLAAAANNKNYLRPGNKDV